LEPNEAIAYTLLQILQKSNRIKLFSCPQLHQVLDPIPTISGNELYSNATMVELFRSGRCITPDRAEHIRHKKDVVLD
jgi:hypothetical protein